MTTLDHDFRQYMFGYMAFPPDDDEQRVTLRDILNATPDERRLPVNNREPRVLMSRQKYALILERDGVGCRYCYEGNGGIEVDHIIPRSAFPASWLDIADRSDNLTVSCVSCNRGKSNKNYSYAKRPGVTPTCWDCKNPGPDPEWDPDAHDEWCDVAAANRNHLVYCGQCGMGAAVPDLSWVL